MNSITSFNAMSSTSKQKTVMLILFAWGVELFGIICGMANSALVTFGSVSAMPPIGRDWLPALPLAVLASLELLRIPLANAYFAKASVVVRALIVAALVALSAIAFENWVFGLERVVTIRLHEVQSAEQAHDSTIVTVATIEDEQKRAASAVNDAHKKHDLTISRLRATRDDINEKAKDAFNEHERNLTQIRESCRLVRYRCIGPQTEKENARFGAQRAETDKALKAVNDDLAQQERAFSDVQAFAAKSDEDLRAAIAKAQQDVPMMLTALHAAKENNQIYRLAGMFFGVKAGSVTPDQFNIARGVFSTFGAILISVTGTIAALVYYSRDRVPGERSNSVKLARAIRAFVGRLRKRPVRKVEKIVERAVEMIVEKPVEVIVYRDGKEPAQIIEKEKLVDVVREQIVLIPRWGIRTPLWINGLIGRSASAQHDELASNVKPLAKAS
jgi:hypothetical protein